MGSGVTPNKRNAEPTRPSQRLQQMRLCKDMESSSAVQASCSGSSCKTAATVLLFMLASAGVSWAGSAPGIPHVDTVGDWSRQLLVQADSRAIVAERVTNLFENTRSLDRGEIPHDRDQRLLDPIEWSKAYSEAVHEESERLGLLPEIRRDTMQLPQAAETRSIETAGAVLRSPQRRQLQGAIRNILQQEALPSHLLAVPLIESGFDRTALSPKGALGVWQLMPDTARRFGLTVNARQDDRLDPIRSTYAAARYLKELYAIWRDWELALAAYNAGEGRVQKALAAGRARTFSDLKQRRALPAETLAYVPAVLRAASRLAESGGSVGIGMTIREE